VLFEPLGFGANEWVLSKDGNEVAASGLRLLPRDMLKIGQLVLTGGAWDGKQVVPADWIKRATTHYTVTDSRIHIRTGLVSRREHSTQLSRVQNVNVTQTIMQRLLGIGDVDWDTAGTEEAESEFRFVGVEDPSSLVRIVDQRLHAIGN